MELKGLYKPEVEIFENVTSPVLFVIQIRTN